uniref:CCHC-type domain-containing protein n=1 Tax=Cyanistes caeruleus TaxID=156563 RepID=A0A8C0U946_CYACU
FYSDLQSVKFLAIVKSVARLGPSRGSEKLKFDEIRDVVLSESIRKREVGESSGNALSVDRRGRSKSKGQNQRGRSKSKNRGKSPNRSNVTCWNCGEKGHFRTNCTKPKKKQNQKSGNDSDSVNSAED